MKMLVFTRKRQKPGTINTLPGSACSASRLPPAATATTVVTRRSPGEFSTPSTVLLLPVGTLHIFVWGGVSGDRVIEFMLDYDCFVLIFIFVR